MPPDIFKQGGQLYETSQEELKKQTASPAGAAGQGATPDQSKMIGTPAQTEAVAKATQQQPTYEQMQRIKPKQQAEPSTTQSAVDKIERMKSLGSIETQLEGLIQQRLQTAQQTTLQQQVVNDEYVKQVAAQEQQAALSTALNEYANATTDAERNEAILKAYLLDNKINKDTINKYFVGEVGAIGAALEEATPESIILGDVWDEATLGNTAQVAADLGITPEELAGMNMQQFEEAIQNVESQEFNKIQNLQAELPSAVGARREAIIRELQGLAQAGVTGIEAQYDRLQKDIEEARTIDIAGQEFELGELLEDETLSKYILSSLSDESVMKQLQEEVPDLVTWIEENREALTGLQETAREDVKGFEDTQKEITQTTAGKEGLADIIGGKRPDYMTDAQWATYKDDLEKSGVWNAASNDAEVNTLFQGEEGQKLAATLHEAGYSEKQIIELKDFNNILRDDSLNVVSEWLGLEKGEFATDYTKIQEFSKIQQGLEAVRKADDAVYGQLKDYPGALDNDQLGRLAAKPENWNAVKASLDATKKLEEDSLDGMLDLVFGEDVDMDDINAKLATLKKYALMGHEPSMAEYKKLKALASDPANKDDEGIFDESDKGRIKALLTSSNSLDDALSGNSLENKMESTRGKLDVNPKGTTAVMDDVIEKGILDDGAVSADESGSLSDSTLNSFLEVPNLKTNHPEIHKALTDELTKRGEVSAKEIRTATFDDMKTVINSPVIAGIFEKGSYPKMMSAKHFNRRSAGDGKKLLKEVESWQAKKKEMSDIVDKLKTKINDGTVKGAALAQYKDYLSLATKSLSGMGSKPPMLDKATKEKMIKTIWGDTFEPYKEGTSLTESKRKQKQRNMAKLEVMMKADTLEFIKYVKGEK